MELYNLDEVFLLRHNIHILKFIPIIYDRFEDWKYVGVESLLKEAKIVKLACDGIFS